MTLSDLLGAVPAIAQLVQQVERPGYGKLKRETVVDLALESMALEYEIPFDLDKFQMWLGIVVDDLVRMFNETGQFQHTTKVEVQSAAQ